MTQSAGPTGELQARFDDGLRFLVTALALGADRRNAAASISAACDAVRCFLTIFNAAAERHLPDPRGEVARLRDQCVALLDTSQEPGEVLVHVLEAARLSRDGAARLLPRLLQGPGA
jgi:hypothetical protein